MILLTAVITFTAAGCTGASDKKIVVGSKNYTENMVLGSIISQLIEEKTDLRVEYKENLGGTMVCYEALKNGQLDIYPEYTGTALTAQLKMDVINDADKVYDIVKEEFDRQFNIKWMKPFGLNNTYAVALPNDFAEKNGIVTVSDLVPFAGELVFGAEHEFFDRQDGYDGMVEAYGLEFSGDPVKMDIAMKYQATAQGRIHVTDAFSTDGQLITYDLKVLEDDKNFFPPYYAAPIIRKETLEKHPELESILNELSGRIDDQTMQQMNYKVESEGMSTREAAREFLKSEGLID
jgi:osmoprotectant transport system substrate-binding protein